MGDWFGQSAPTSLDARYSQKLSLWPQAVTVGLAVVALGVATIRSWQASVAAYLILLTIGSTLIFWDRVREVVRSRDVRVQWLPVSQGWRWAALASIIGGCLANGIVVAVWVATR